MSQAAVYGNLIRIPPGGPRGMDRAFEERYRIESRLSAVHDVEREVLRALTDMGYAEDDLFNVRLALDEACMNAIKHGNREDPEKGISIGVRVDPRKVRMEVQDEGNGFDYTRMLDPREIDRLQQTGGRGLFLIQQFMEQVYFKEEGSRIVMVYRKGGDKDRSTPIRKRVFNEIVIIDVFRPVGAEAAQAWLHEVERAIAGDHVRIILDLRRGSEPCSEFCRAIVKAAEMVGRAGGSLVVICPYEQAREHLGDRAGKQVPHVEESLPEALRRLSRGEVKS